MIPRKFRCPHGNNKYVCDTCVEAEKRVDQYWTRQKLAANVGNIPYYPSPEVKVFGEKVMQSMYDADIRKSMAGLGGCKPLDLADFDTDVQPYIQEYLRGDLDSLAIAYAAMRAREVRGKE